MTPPLSVMRTLDVVGPEAGFTVVIGGADAYAELDGSPVSMPHTPDVWNPGDPDAAGGVIVGGRVFYYVDVPDAVVQLRVIVTALDGTILLDRGVTSIPAVVDALRRQVFLQAPS